MIRSTWLPAILCEGATLTIPAQEAALADSTFREAYALGIANGVAIYFRQLRLQATAGQRACGIAAEIGRARSRGRARGTMRGEGQGVVGGGARAHYIKSLY